MKSSRRRQLLLAGVLAFVALITPVAYWRSKLRSAKDSAVTQTHTASSVRSVAVLPFENQTKHRASEYLTDAIPQTLTTLLGAYGKVITTGKYTGKALDMQEDANTLGFTAIMTGRVAKRGDSIVVSIELIDARDKSQIWREEYTRKLTHVLEVQLDIAKQITQRLGDMAFTEFFIEVRNWNASFVNTGKMRQPRNSKLNGE